MKHVRGAWGFGGCGLCVQGVTKGGKWPEVFCLSLHCYDPLDGLG